MNRKLILNILGFLLLTEAGALLICTGVALYYGEGSAPGLAITAALAGGIGILLSRLKANSTKVGYREGFVIATLGWLTMAAFGALPFVISGFLSPIDAIFESMSGFTTTGASVITNVEALPRGIMFWRCFTQWFGGMGTIVLILALVPSLKIAGMSLFRAEVPGPTKDKVLPQITQTSRELYKVYIIISAAEVVALKIAGLPWYDSFIHTFTTVSTGGFSNQGASIASYNSVAVDLIIVFFMVVGGISFALHHYWLHGNFAPLWKDFETKVYLGILGVGTILIAINLIQSLGYNPVQAARYALFQVASITTTTGFATADFDAWPDFSRLLLLLLMFFGGCAGSTAGSIKIARIIILFKYAVRQMSKLFHPRAIIPVRLGNKVVDKDALANVQAFFYTFISIFALGAVIMTALGLDLITSISAVAACITNVGPGLALVGPMANYAAVPDLGKLVLSFCMLVGRLELFTVLLLFTPRFWK
ncbi:MAG: TrkH family potassium uptake protein [Peptococcaceae bacterium]|nr:TrkH family potassium uptake protein [Peptococcaceae bacterium]